MIFKPAGQRVSVEKYPDHYPYSHSRYAPSYLLAGNRYAGRPSPAGTMPVPRVGSMLLAQINVARMRAAPDSPAMGGFMAAVDPVYRLADRSAGFVWRLPGAGGHMPTCRDDADGWQVVNVSVWASYEALHDFVYRSGHGGLIRRRSAWFLPTRQPSTALWWLPDDRRPTLEQARARLALLRTEGPSPRAFSLRRRFDPDGRPVAARSYASRSTRAGSLRRTG
jgi:hypothetical protein